MSKIILIDAKLKSEYDNLQSLLSGCLEFLNPCIYSKEPHIIEQIQHCSIERMWNYQKKMLEIQKQMYRGEIIV
jgi:hypothetical protein